MLRVALAVGALAKQPLFIHSIRAGRPNPGLGHQHSTGAKLVADLCGGLLWPSSIQYGGHAPGHSDLRLWPGKKNSRLDQVIADTHTAGAITLLLQAALPCALLRKREGTVRKAGELGTCSSDFLGMTLKGGTNTRASPGIDFMSLVLFPVLTHFGVPETHLHLDIKRRGFFPLGGGEVHLQVLLLLLLLFIKIISG